MSSVSNLLMMIDAPLILAMAVFTVAVLVVLLCVPGTLVPLTVASSLLTEPWIAAIAVLSGTTLGCQLQYCGLAYVAEDRLRSNCANWVVVDGTSAQRGFFSLLGMRVIGVPQFLTTAASVVAAIRPSTFALANFLGRLPAVLAAALCSQAL